MHRVMNHHGGGTPRPRRRALALFSCVFVVGALCLTGARRTVAQTPPPAPKPAASGSAEPAADESLLGEVPVNGSAGTVPLPKMAVVPIAATTDADGTVQSVVRRDLDLCGQYDMVPMDVV